MNPLKPSFIFPEPLRSPEGMGGWGSTKVNDVNPAAVQAAVSPSVVVAEPVSAYVPQEPA